VCLGEATKFSQFLLNADKSYFVTAKLGERTDTSDADGEIIDVRKFDSSENEIKQAIQTFIGPNKQVPSMFSALKHNGKPLYYYARQGISVEREARDIHIYNIEWCELKGDELSLNVSCSKGTYIRTLIDDLGQVLGCGAHVKVLRRTGVAHYNGHSMYSFSELEKLVTQHGELSLEALDKLLLPMDSAILDLPSMMFSDQDIHLFQHGGFIEPIKDANITQNELFRIYEQNTSRFIGIGFVNKDLLIQPKRLVVYL